MSAEFKVLEYSNNVDFEAALNDASVYDWLLVGCGAVWSDKSYGVKYWAIMTRERREE